MLTFKPGTKKQNRLNNKPNITQHYIQFPFEAGTDIRYIQQLLGHSSIKTTMIYTHIARGAKDKVQSPLDRIMENKNKEDNKNNLK